MLFEMFGYDIRIDFSIEKTPKPKSLTPPDDDDFLHIRLNNLYLAIERGEITMTKAAALHLRDLAGKLQDDFLKLYWEKEFEKLPNWLDF